MNGLHFFIALTEIDREMHASVRAAGPYGVTDPDEERQQASRLRRLFGLDQAPVAQIETRRQPASPPRQAA